jgi:hypothetical protein
MKKASWLDRLTARTKAMAAEIAEDVAHRALHNVIDQETRLEALNHAHADALEAFVARYKRSPNRGELDEASRVAEQERFVAGAVEAAAARCRDADTIRARLEAYLTRHGLTEDDLEADDDDTASR